MVVEETVEECIGIFSQSESTLQQYSQLDKLLRSWDGFWLKYFLAEQREYIGMWILSDPDVDNTRTVKPSHNPVVDRWPWPLPSYTAALQSFAGLWRRWWRSKPERNVSAKKKQNVVRIAFQTGEILPECYQILTFCCYLSWWLHLKIFVKGFSF